MGTKMAVALYDSVLEIRTHYKPAETFRYTYYSSCHPPGFIKGEALRLLRTNSSKTKFEETSSTSNHILSREGFPESLVQRTLAEVNLKT